MQTDKKIVKYSQLTKIHQKANRDKKKIVFTTGCYDLLHLGHIIHFNFCKNQGDVLVVSIGNDKTVKDLKGKNRPINNQKMRARMIAALSLVDYVVISEEFGKMDHNFLIKILKPDIFVLNATDSAKKEKKILIEKNGGELLLCKRLPPQKLKGGISTTQLEEKIARLG